MNREQFISHVEGTQRELRRFLRALCCGDSQLADDIAQETYVKAYLSCDGFNSPEKFKAWVYKIAYNTFLDQKRAYKPTTDYREATTVCGNEPSDKAFAYEPLYKALDLLPSNERTSVLLFYMDGYSIKEISEMTEVSQDAVKKHLERGRKHLRNLLEPDSSQKL